MTAAELQARRERIHAGQWHAAHQLHSDRVVEVGPQVQPAPPADALVTRDPGVVLAVHSGDCVPIGLVHHAGYLATVHAGWKGLDRGVIESAVRHLRSLAGSGVRIDAAVGPHIRAPRYEFDSSHAAILADRFGRCAIGTTSWDTTALNLTGAVLSELTRLGVSVEAVSTDCTAADASQYWSHRARSESGRIALVAWIDGRDGRA